MAQSIEITYGALIIGGSSHTKIRKYTYRRLRGELNFSCEFLVADSDVDTFAGLVSTVEGQAITADLRLKIIIGTVTILDVGEDDFTAFDVIPEISKVGDVVDTVRTRIYTLTVSARLNPSKAGFSGRFGTEIQTVFLGNRARRVSFRLNYSATSAPATTALARYLATGKLFAQAFLDNLDTPSKKWQIKSEDITQDEGLTASATAQKPTVVNVSLQYDELVASQTTKPDELDPKITSQNITISRSQVGIEDSIINGQRAKKFEDFGITYRCEVNKELERDLKTFYDTTVRALALDKIQKRFPTFGGALTVEDVNFSDDANTIEVQFRFTTAAAGQFIKISFEQTLLTNEGLIITPLLFVDPLLADLQQGPKTIQLRRVLTQTYILKGKKLPFPKDPAGYVRTSSPEESIKVFEIGRLGRRILVAQLRQAIEYRRINQYQGGGRIGRIQSVAGSSNIEVFDDLVAVAQTPAGAGGTGAQGTNIPKVSP